MANIDHPSGLRPVYRLGGGKVPMRPYEAGDTTAIYQGDVVKLKSNGRVIAEVTTTGTDKIVGVAANYVAAGDGGPSGTTCWVYDDPFTVFALNSDGATDPGSTTAQGHIGNQVNLVLTTGNTTTKVSKQELDYSTITTATGDHALRVLGFENNVRNDKTLAHADYMVMFARHMYMDKENVV